MPLLVRAPFCSLEVIGSVSLHRVTAGVKEHEEKSGSKGKRGVKNDDGRRGGGEVAILGEVL